MAWISIRAYCKKKGLKSPQLVYNRIYTGKLIKGKDWREVVVTKIVKQIKDK